MWFTCLVGTLAGLYMELSASRAFFQVTEMAASYWNFNSDLTLSERGKSNLLPFLFIRLEFITVKIHEGYFLKQNSLI